MSDKEGKWLPYNQDGGQHDCKKNGKKVKVATIDGLAALDLIPHLGEALQFSETEIRGAKVIEVFLDK